MSETVVKALIALVPAVAFLVGSAALFRRAREFSSLLQLLGSVGLVMVAVTHICEGLRLFPMMRWGSEHSPGHYLDLACAVIAFTLLPLGYLLYAFRGRRG